MEIRRDRALNPSAVVLAIKTYTSQPWREAGAGLGPGKAEMQVQAPVSCVAGVVLRCSVGQGNDGGLLSAPP
jgi:hypothetical protein